MVLQKSIKWCPDFDEMVFRKSIKMDGLFTSRFLAEIVIAFLEAELKASE